MKTLKRMICTILAISIMCLIGVAVTAESVTRDAITRHTIPAGTTMYYWIGDPGVYVFENSDLTLYVEFDKNYSLHTTGYKNMDTGAFSRVRDWYNTNGSYTSTIMQTAGFYRSALINGSGQTITVVDGFQSWNF